MNQSTITSLSDLPEQDKLFAEVIIHIIKMKYKGFVEAKDTVNLAHIHMSFGIEDPKNREYFENPIGLGNLRKIAIMERCPSQKWDVTTQMMLDIFRDIGEIDELIDGDGNVVYKLSKGGLLYQHVESLG